MKFLHLGWAVLLVSFSALAEPDVTYPSGSYLGLPNEVDPYPSVYLLFTKKVKAGEPKAFEYPNCVGTVIGERTILTAGHCVSTQKDGKWQLLEPGAVFAIHYEKFREYIRAHKPLSVPTEKAVHGPGVIHAKGKYIAGWVRGSTDVSFFDLAFVVFNDATIDGKSEAPFQRVAPMPLSCNNPVDLPKVTLVGFMTDYIKKWGEGAVAGVDNEGDGAIYLAKWFSSLPQPGDSGGPILRSDALVGVVSGKVSKGLSSKYIYANPNAPMLKAELRRLLGMVRTQDPTVPKNFPCD